MASQNRLALACRSPRTMRPRTMRPRATRPRAMRNWAARNWVTRFSALFAVSALALGLSGPGGAAASSPSWQRQATPSPPDAGLAGVSCPTVRICIAVGQRSLPSRTAPLVEGWAGTSWTIAVTPIPPGPASSDLQSVSCPSPVSCVAVGDEELSPGVAPKPFSEVLHGTRWTIVSPPPLPSGQAGELTSVSCAAPTSCRAVGSVTTGPGHRSALIESFDGRAWSRDEAAAASAPSSALAGVSCLVDTVPALCTAVGSQTTAGRTTPLVEHANAHHWSAVAVPGVASSPDVTLTSVSCPEPTSCVAVGSARHGSVTQSLSEVEDLLRWTVVATPHPTLGDNLFGVSCALSIDSCRAVGGVGVAASATLAEAWNGHSWSIRSSADPSPLSILLAVSCATVASGGPKCTAVGSYQPQPDVGDHTLAERN